MKFLTLLWAARRYISELCSMGCWACLNATPPSTPWETVIKLYVLNFLLANAKRQSEVFVQKFHTILLEAQQLNWNQVELRWGFSAIFVTLDGFSTFPTFLHTHSQQQLNSECVKIFCSFFISPAIIIHTVWNDVLIYPFAQGLRQARKLEMTWEWQTRQITHMHLIRCVDTSPATATINEPLFLFWRREKLFFKFFLSFYCC